MRAIAMLDLVRRLLTHEAEGRQDQDSLIAATERVLAKLRAHLSKRIGREGFRTLLARALTLIVAQFPHLGVVRVAGDGSLVGLRRVADSDPQEMSDTGGQGELVAGSVALVAQLLALLVTFIGDDITRRMLSTVWPELALDNGSGSEDERP